MKLSHGLAAIALLAAPGCAAKAPAAEWVELTYDSPFGEVPARLRVTADGAVTARGACCGDVDTRMTMQDHARFVALVAPMRAYAGGAMPCRDHLPSEGEIARNPLAAAGKPAAATLRWETGDTVRLNLVCRDAPPALAKLRDALDIVKRLGTSAIEETPK